MAYRSSPAASGVPVEAADALDAEIAASSEALRILGDALRAARGELEDVIRSSDAKVALAEEQRRRSLLRALSLAPEGPEADGLRAALRAEHRERELRLAVARARAPEVFGAAGDPPELETAQAALALAREERARRVASASARARELEERLHALELELDDRTRERDRLRAR